MGSIAREKVKGGRMVLLSFIVPVYNTEKYLEKCLNSILNQTCKDFEVIVINDGSKDDSDKILKKYEEKYSEQLRVIRQENHGIGYTRNKGIELAAGKYITFIDSDDAIEPTYCEKLCGMAEKNNLDMVVCDYYEVYEMSGEKKYWEVVDFGVTDLKDTPKLLFEINSSPWNKIYRTELLKKMKLDFQKI